MILSRVAAWARCTNCNGLRLAVFLDWIVWDTLSILANVTIVPWLGRVFNRGARQVLGKYSVGKEKLMHSMMASPWLSEALQDGHQARVLGAQRATDVDDGAPLSGGRSFDV